MEVFTYASMVFEEMKLSFANFGGRHGTKEHLALYPDRRVRKQWVIFVILCIVQISVPQIIPFVRDTQTPHYQVNANGLSEFQERVRQAGLQCIVYHPDCSYVKSGSFVQVWNPCTPQWDDIKDEYDACNSRSARVGASVGASEFHMSDRGNRTMSFGFTVQSYQPDPTTFVQKPATREGTALWDKHMQCLSLLVHKNQTLQGLVSWCGGVGSRFGLWSCCRVNRALFRKLG